jgi:hypothetical protein
MSQLNPAKALNGARIGHICDRCNKRVQTGDLVRAYATHYEGDGWILRRVWCKQCGDTTIDSTTEDADEILVEAVFWDHRLVSVEVRDRSGPHVGSEQ